MHSQRKTWALVNWLTTLTGPLENHKQKSRMTWSFSEPDCCLRSVEWIRTFFHLVIQVYCCIQWYLSSADNSKKVNGRCDIFFLNGSEGFFLMLDLSSVFSTERAERLCEMDFSESCVNQGSLSSNSAQHVGIHTPPDISSMASHQAINLNFPQCAMSNYSFV